MAFYSETNNFQKKKKRNERKESFYFIFLKDFFFNLAQFYGKVIFLFHLTGLKKKTGIGNMFFFFFKYEWIFQ